MKCAIVFLISAVVFLGVEDAFARSQRVSQIPNGGVNSCANCHVDASGGGARNAFGQTVEQNFLTSSGPSGSVIWNAQLAGMDSDGDGFSNGTELGDPDGDGTPTSGAQVTNPGSASSFPQVMNNPPVFGSIAAQTVDEGKTLTFTVTATDPNNDTVTITTSNLPSGATFANRTFTWTPGFAQSGNFTVTFTANDGRDSATLSVQITVRDVPQAPVFARVDSQRVKEGEALSFTVSATDADSPNITLSAGDLPTGATFANGILTWMPGLDQAGNYTIRFTASDGTLSTTLDVHVTVENTPQAPTIAAIDPQTVAEGVSLSLSVNASDADGDTITLSAGNLPTGATFAGSTLSWTPNFDQAGEYTITITATDGVLETSLSVQITVTDASRPLSIVSTQPDRNLVVGTVGDTIRFSVVVGAQNVSNVVYTWTVNGNAQTETSSSLLHTVGAGSTDDAIAVTVSEGASSQSHSWTVTKALTGDFNGNGRVDFPDFLIFVGQFGKTSADPDFNASVDLNGNGSVDFADFLIFVRFFGLSL